MSLTFVSISMQDAAGSVDTTTLRFESEGLTLTDIVAFVQEYVSRVDAITEAKITGITVALEVALPGTLKASPAANSNNNEGANFRFYTDSAWADTIRIPALDQSLFSGKTDVQTAGTTAIDNFIGIIINGFGSPAGLPADRYGNDYTGVASGKRSWHTK